MHGTSTFSLLLLLLLTSSMAQWLNNVNVPACARSCASTLPAGCNGNPKCVCKDTAWMIKAQCCVQASCSNHDMATTEQFAAQLCNFVGAPVPRPSVCPGISKPQGSSSTLSSVTVKPSSKSESASTKRPTSTGTSSLSKALVDGYRYEGCYSEANNGGRILDRTYYIDLVGNTVEKCVAFCKANGHSMAGVEYSQECWCGSEIRNGGKKLDGAEGGKCNLPCKGNVGQVCGGMAVVGVWKSG